MGARLLRQYGICLSVGMPDLLIRGAPESRFTLERESGAELLERLVAANAAAGMDPLNLLVVVAHPDDEAIGAGALLRGYPNATIVHLTDGGGADIPSVRARGFASREDYAHARRREVLAALALVGIPSSQVRCLGIPDGDAGRRLLEVSRLVMDVFDDVRPDVVLTHPYEGGHSDHDAAAFAVHLAAGMLRRDGVGAPLVLELTSYHNRNGERIRGEFLPNSAVPDCEMLLGEEARELKRRMFDAFASQRDVVRPFGIHAERFRIAPRYVFTEPPHAGLLEYERRCVRITGAEWRAMAERALAALRSRRRARRG